jgi:hypothetical protein
MVMDKFRVEKEAVAAIVLAVKGKKIQNSILSQRT